MRKFVPCKVETAAVVGHAGTVKNMTPKKKEENAMKTKQLGQKDRQNKKLRNTRRGLVQHQTKQKVELSLSLSTEGLPLRFRRRQMAGTEQVLIQSKEKLSNVRIL